MSKDKENNKIESVENEESDVSKIEDLPDFSKIMSLTGGNSFMNDVFGKSIQPTDRFYEMLDKFFSEGFRTRTKLTRAEVYNLTKIEIYASYVKTYSESAYNTIKEYIISNLPEWKISEMENTGRKEVFEMFKNAPETQATTWRERRQLRKERLE